MTSKFGIILYENVQPLDVIGPWEVLALWKNILKAPIELYLISEQETLVECDNHIVLKAHCHFNDAPQLDCLMVPGGRGRVAEVNNEKTISFIQKQAAHCKYVLSVCTGMFLLHKAGLLKNKTATTYWRAFDELHSFADVEVVEERIVKCGNIWTAGGVSSGIDLALELIAEIAGRKTAGKVQLLLEYFPRDTIYCSADTANTLPPYNDNAGASKPASLPHYIKKYLPFKK